MTDKDFGNFMQEMLSTMTDTLDTKTLRLAVLFDGDNISHSSAKDILAKAREFGNVSLSRVYGDLP